MWPVILLSLVRLFFKHHKTIQGCWFFGRRDPLLMIVKASYTKIINQGWISFVNNYFKQWYYAFEDHIVVILAIKFLFWPEKSDIVLCIPTQPPPLILWERLTFLGGWQPWPIKTHFWKLTCRVASTPSSHKKRWSWVQNLYKKCSWSNFANFELSNIMFFFKIVHCSCNSSYLNYYCLMSLPSNLLHLKHFMARPFQRVEFKKHCLSISLVKFEQSEINGKYYQTLFFTNK